MDFYESYIDWVKEKLSVDKLRKLLICWAIDSYMINDIALDVLEVVLTEDIYQVIFEPEKMLSKDHIEGGEYIREQLEEVYKKCRERLE